MDSHPIITLLNRSLNFWTVEGRALILFLKNWNPRRLVVLEIRLPVFAMGATIKQGSVRAAFSTHCLLLVIVFDLVEFPSPPLVTRIGANWIGNCAILPTGCHFSPQIRADYPIQSHKTPFPHC